MTDLDYTWDRFWVPRSGSIDLSDGGYLVDPDDAARAWKKSELISSESIADSHCLVLLGEPGMGKTHAMQGMYDTMASGQENVADRIVCIDLNEFTTDVRLVEGVFKNTKVQTWLNGSHILTLFLDSLDECFLSVRTVANILANNFAKLPVGRLRLRIACRTSTWPPNFERRLETLWPRGGLQVLELAPLRRVDVMAAANANGLDAENFIAAVDAMRVTPFATKPVTLRFLLDSYANNRCLPASQSEIYLEGCRRLCQEVNPSRVDSSHLGDLDADERLAVASRVAALMLLCNRTAVVRDEAPIESAPSDILVSELCGDDELAAATRVPVTRAAIHETLDTGLFSSRGPSRMGWAHQSYAEFLAARYLHEHSMGLDRSKSLLFVSSTQAMHVVPQLREVAAWLALTDAELFGLIAAQSPEVLVGSAAAAMTNSQKGQLVRELLAASESRQLADDRLIRSGYSKLCHPELAEVLRAYIEGANAPVETRCIATDIAEQCGLRVLWNSILSVATDRDSPAVARENAAWALYRLADDTCVMDMSALIGLDADNDPHDELRGCALRALWPRHLTASELFHSLTAPRAKSLLGTYSLFLSHELEPGLRDTDLDVAVDWVRNQYPEFGSPYYYRELADAIAYRAWIAFDRPEVARAFATLAVARQRGAYDIIQESKYQRPFAEALQQDDAKRRRLIIEMASILLEGSDDSPGFVLMDVVSPSDTQWLIERYELAQSCAERRLWADSLRYCLVAEDRLGWEAAYRAAAKYPLIRESLAARFAPVGLDSPEAQAGRRSLERAALTRKHGGKLSSVLKAGQLQSLLEDVENGNTASWYGICRLIGYHGPSRPGFAFDTDGTTFASSKEPDDSANSRIIAAAFAFVLERSPLSSDWIATGNYPESCVHEYGAFHLILQEQPLWLDDLDDDVWLRWSPTLVAAPFVENDLSSYYRLVALAYAQAPDPVTGTMLRLVDYHSGSGTESSRQNALKDVWNQQLTEAFMQKAQEPQLSSATTRSLLVTLLSRDPTHAREVTEAIATGTGAATVDHSVAAALALAWTGQASSWDLIWGRVEADTSFGDHFVSDLAVWHDDRGGRVLAGLHETQLGRVLDWMYQRYPPEEDPKIEAAHTPSAREEVGYWRLAVLRELMSRCSPSAVDALAGVLDANSRYPGLRVALAELREKTYGTMWRPPSPDHVLALVRDTENRFIDGGSSLLDLIEESLARYQAKLHGETPSVPGLWNELPTGVSRPKDEAWLSDCVRNHLDDDLRGRGIVVNREVQIHRGERTDIYVAAVRTTEASVEDTVKVIIEVKGCWHPELKAAMRTQLVERYMCDNECRHGLYVIAWFVCPEWDDGDWRKQNTPALGLDDARTLFDSQATSLSTEDVQVRSYLLDAAMR